MIASPSTTSRAADQFLGAAPTNIPFSRRSSGLGDAGARRTSEADPIEPGVVQFDEFAGDAGTIRGALLTWLAGLSSSKRDASTFDRIESFEHGDATIQTDNAAEPLEPATASENCIRKLRANAHAAYRSIERGPVATPFNAAALDAALAVVEAKWQAEAALRDVYAEALKSIRLYAPDPKSRALADQTLCLTAGRPTTPRAERDQSCGWAKYPFLDEFDA